jgi:hypothetical protein
LQHASAIASVQRALKFGPADSGPAAQTQGAYDQLVADRQANRLAKPKPGVGATNGPRLKRPSVGTLRGKHQSQNLRFARGSATP